MTATSSESDTDSFSAPPGGELPAVSDRLGARLQARLEAIEAEPERLAPASRPRATSGSSRVPGPAAAGSVADLNAQLDVLRGQLEVAFDEMDARVAAAEHSAHAAQARVAEVVAAIDELANDLPQLGDPRRPGDVDRLHAALTRLRARLRPR